MHHPGEYQKPNMVHGPSNAMRQAPATHSNNQPTRAGVLMPPNMLMSMVQPPGPRGMPHIPMSMTQMSSAMQQLPRGMPRIPASMSQIPNSVQNVTSIGPCGDSFSPYNMVMQSSGQMNVDPSLSKNGFSLMNMDMSSSNFMKVMNFDMMSTMANGSGDTGQHIDRAGDTGQHIDRAAVDEDDQYSQYSQSEDGDYAEHSILETSADQVEHQQAQAQALLLDRFKQLREWQTSQQEILVRQQQDQLNQLRQEQSRVQRIIVKQRENQWGSNGPTKPVQKVCDDSSAKISSQIQNKPPVYSQTPVPEPIPQPTTPKGRPMPNIMSEPSTPLEYLEYGNPALDSDNTTIASGTPLEGINRLADSASECSESPSLSQVYFHSKSHQDLPAEELYRKSNLMNKFGAPISFAKDDLRQQSVNSDILNVQIAALSQAPFNQSHFSIQNGPLFLNNGMQRMPNATGFQQNRFSVQNGMLDLQQNSHGTKYGTSKNDNGGITVSEGFQVHEEDEEDQEDGDSESFYEDQEEDKGSEIAEEDDSDETPQNDLDLEEKPIAGAAKTFEQLLEEELKKEETRMKATEEQKKTALSSGKRTFLRRGEGIARFQNPIKRPMPRKPETKQSGKASSGQSSQSGAKSLPASNKQQDVKPAAKKTTIPQQLNKKEPINSKKKTEQNASSNLITKVPQARLSTSPQKPGASVQNIHSHNKQKVVPLEPAQSRLPADLPQKTPGDSTGETSFQQCMNDRALHEEVETEELEEFEILEQYADDNASFLSNMSAVRQVVHAKKTSKNTENDLSRNMKTQGFNFTAAPNDRKEDCDSESDQSEDSQLNGTLVESLSGKNVDYDSSEYSPDKQTAILRTLQRKVSSLGSRSPKNIKPTEPKFEMKTSTYPNTDTWEDFEPANQNAHGGHMIEDSEQSEASSEEEEDSDNSDDVDVKDIIQNSKLNKKLITRENSLPNKKQDIEYKSNGTDIAQFSHAKSSPGMPPAEATQASFSDDEEWGEEFKNQKSSPVRNKHAASGPIIKTRVALGQHETDSQSTTPPTSKLVSKLFPKLKPDPPKQPAITAQQEQQLTIARQTVVGDGLQSKALRDKLAELEREIERFRTENSNLEKLRKEREEGLEHIKREMAEFEKQKSEELERLQQFKTEEMKKLKKEKRIFEQYQKTARMQPDKKEREEIESLRKQLGDLQDELKRKEQRWSSSTKRLRDRLDCVEQENSELKEEVKLLEKKRLEVWQKQGVAPSVATALSENLKHEEQPKSEAASQNKESSKPKPISKFSLPQASMANSAIVKTTMPTSSASRPLIPLLVPTASSQQNGFCDDDNDSEFPDSASQAAANLNMTNDESLIMQTAPKAMKQVPNKALTSSPQHNGISEPLSVRSGSSGGVSTGVVSRKTAIPANISRAIDKGDEKYEELQHSDGKIERIYTNGAREILFSNGTRKQVSANGQSIIVCFFNGDMKQILPDQRVVYFYADAQTTHTTYPDGLEIILFPNSQTEKHYPDGTREISFPDQTIKYLFPNGIEESIFPNGTVIRIERNGDKVMEFPNGQREVHTPQYKRREYPDGTVKTVYPDGRQETRYSSGRIRVKDRDGQIIVDRRM